MQQETKNTVTAMESIDKIISEINTRSRSISTVFNEQTLAIKEIASSAQVAASNSMDVINQADNLSASSNQSLNDIKDLVTSTNELNNNSNKLKLEIENFLQNLGKS